MKIGVTGGTGFIGSHIVDQLIENKHEVVVLDVIAPDRTDVEFIYTNILDYESCIKATKGLDVIYHLAAMANANNANLEKNNATMLNVQGTSNLLNASGFNGIARFIYASTEWVYSALEKEGKTITVVESDVLDPNRMKHIYSLTKYMGELLCKSICSTTENMDFTILRFGIPYGPRSWSGTVFNNFMNNALEGKSIKIMGSGNQFRKFIYVTDLAKGCVKALDEVAKNQIYNLPGKESISILEVAEVIKKKFEGQVSIEFVGERIDDYGGTLASGEKAKIDLHWSPEIPIEVGVALYYDWLKNKQMHLI